jgi:hypothetical protein
MVPEATSDRLFERRGGTASLSGRVAIVAGFLCLWLAWLVLWADRIRRLSRLSEGVRRSLEELTATAIGRESHPQNYPDTYPENQGSMYKKGVSVIGINSIRPAVLWCHVCRSAYIRGQVGVSRTTVFFP